MSQCNVESPLMTILIKSLQKQFKSFSYCFYTQFKHAFSAQWYIFKEQFYWLVGHPIKLWKTHRNSENACLNAVCQTPGRDLYREVWVIMIDRQFVITLLIWFDSLIDGFDKDRFRHTDTIIRVQSFFILVSLRMQK